VILKKTKNCIILWNNNLEKEEAPVKEKIFSNAPQELKEQDRQTPLEYTPPKIITYTSEEILEQIGPAHACSPLPCVVD